MKRFFAATLVAMISVIFCLGANGQSMSFMAVGSDVETLGMGGASIASGANGAAPDNNIASAALYEGRMIADAGYMLWQPDGFNSSIINLSGFVKVGKRLAVGVSGKYLVEQPYDIYNGSGLASGSFRPKEGGFGIGASYRIIKGLSVGANLKLASSAIAPEASANVFAADIHAMYTVKGVNVGLGVSNLGTKADYGYGKYDIPTMVRLGASWSGVGLTVNGEVDWQPGGGILASAGAEYSICGLVDVRAGYHYGGAETVLPSFASVGLGAGLFGVRLNAAYLIAPAGSYLNGTFAVSVGYAF